MTSEDTRRGVIYARISRDGKEGSGLGVAKQEEDCRELAARLGINVVDVRTDNDLTAFKGASRSKPRPGYDALLGDIRSGRADVVLAWHTDRLHRDMTDLEDYITACGEGRSGVPTNTVKGGDLDLSTASGRMVARILGAVARQEVEHMIERQKSAKERNRKAGAWSGGPRPYGFRKDGPSIKQGGQGGLAQVPEEAAAIRWAASQVLAGHRHRTAIARQWNGAGLRHDRREAVEQRQHPACAHPRAERRAHRVRRRPGRQGPARHRGQGQLGADRRRGHLARCPGGLSPTRRGGRPGPKHRAPADRRAGLRDPAAATTFRVDPLEVGRRLPVRGGRAPARRGSRPETVAPRPPCSSRWTTSSSRSSSSACPAPTWWPPSTPDPEVDIPALERPPHHHQLRARGVGARTRHHPAAAPDHQRPAA